MKKIIILCLCLFITGCSAEQKEDVKLSNLNEMILSLESTNEVSSWTLLTATEFYPLRLEALKQGEFEEAKIIHSVHGSGEELLITDPQELDKLEQFFDSLMIAETIDGLGPSNDMAAFEITVKDKGPIRLYFYEEALINETTRFLLNMDITLEELIDSLHGEVIRKDIELPSVYFIFRESYADIASEVNLNNLEVKPILKDSSNFIFASWGGQYDSFMNTLWFFNYIDEDFQNVNEIENTSLLIAGLVQQSTQYECFEMREGYCYHPESNDIIKLSSKDVDLTEIISSISTAVPFYYNVVFTSTVESKGKEIFGEDFQLPPPSEEILRQNLRTTKYVSELDLFINNLPYESFGMDEDVLIVFDQYETGEEIHVKFFKAHVRTNPLESVLIGIDNYTIPYDSRNEEETFALLQQHSEHFEQWEAVLKKTDTDYQILSGKCLNPYETSYEADPTKPVVYRDAENDVQVNLSSLDALHFNRWVKNQENVTYKENIHENLLTIFVSGEEPFAVVFDLATNKALSPMEVKEYLQIDEEKLSSAYNAILDTDTYISLDYYHNPLPDLQTTNLFIDSHGNPAMILHDQVYLFTWEEVR